MWIAKPILSDNKGDMKTIAKTTIVVAALALVLTGCKNPQAGSVPGMVTTSHTISIEELARQLGMRIDDRDEGFVVLRDGRNTVLIFTHSDGRFFVNGKPIGPVGPVRNSGGTTYVSESLASQIKPLLGGAPVVPVRPQPRGVLRGDVVIDPGHGAHDPGTTSVTGVHEKMIDYAVAAKVAAILQRRGIQVTMTERRENTPNWRSVQRLPIDATQTSSSVSTLTRRPAHRRKASRSTWPTRHRPILSVLLETSRAPWPQPGWRAVGSAVKITASS